MSRDGFQPRKVVCIYWTSTKLNLTFEGVGTRYIAQEGI